MRRKIIGLLVISSPTITILICSGIFVVWWFPLAIIAFCGVVGGLTFLGLRIMKVT